MSRRTGRLAVAAATAAYGIVMVVANWNNYFITNDFTPRSKWVLFNGSSGFPDDFGRSVFPGTIALGLMYIAVAALVALLAGTRPARVAGGVLVTVSLLLVVTYREDGNLLGARPSAAAALLAVGLYLVASAFSPSPTD